MRIRAVLLVLCAAMWSSSASAQEKLKVSNAGLTRTISSTGGLLKTVGLEANGLQMLDGPSVEFMIDIEYNGENFTLVPSDFKIEGSDTVKRKREVELSILLNSHHEQLPISIWVNYFADAEAGFQQKSIRVRPCGKAPGAVLKCVVIDDFRLLEQFVPVSPVDLYAGKEGNAPEAEANDAQGGFRFDMPSEFAAIDPKSNKGIYFLVPSVSGREMFTVRRRLIMAERMSVPLEKGYLTAKATIGSVAGPPEAIHKQFREFLLGNYYTYLSRKQGFSAFKERFNSYFDVCQYVRAPGENEGFDAEGHIVDNKGFIMLFNPAGQPEKVLLPLSEPGLGLTGNLELSDWTEFGSPSAIGTAMPDSKIEIELLPASAKIIGINVGL